VNLVEEAMFLFRIVGRIAVVTIGIVLQVLVAVKSPESLRFVQKIADSANDTLIDELPDTYAVWSAWLAQIRCLYTSFLSSSLLF
jgi:hypothetical protein